MIVKQLWGTKRDRAHREREGFPVNRRYIPLLTELPWVWGDAKVETSRPYGALKLGFDVDDIAAPWREEIGCQAGVTFRS